MNPEKQLADLNTNNRGSRGESRMHFNLFTANIISLDHRAECDLQADVVCVGELGILVTSKT